MRAEDLMLGDWVQKLEVGGHYRKCRIKAIFDDGVIDCVTSDGEVHTLSVNGIEPIPLTTEILKHNGLFSRPVTENQDVWKECYQYVEEDGRGIVTVYVREDAFHLRVSTLHCSVEKTFAHYVHELQRALKLCGIDKDIEL